MSLLILSLCALVRSSNALHNTGSHLGHDESHLDRSIGRSTDRSQLFASGRGDYPSIFIPQYSRNKTLIARQNVCDRFRNYEENPSAELHLALEGLELHVAAITTQFFLVDEDGKIREDYPGLAAVIMDELASRGRFTWRNSFAYYDGPGDHHTWTELLLWTTDYYDVSMEWWTETLGRLKQGVSFPEGWYDSSYILVGVNQGHEEASINLWVWLEPFEGGVWILILVTILLSAVVYQFLEYLGLPERHRGSRRRDTLGNNIFLSMLMFTQHFQFNPRTPASRIFASSLALWALLISSAYTANLASYFVIQNRPQLHVESIDDAIRAGLPLCIYDTTASAMYVEQSFPKANTIRKKTEIDLYTAVNEGECALAVTSTSSFLEFEKDQRSNPDCKLTWVGRTIEKIPAGFATKSDAGKLCTSLIRDVLDLHMVEMKNDGFIDRAWKEHLMRNQDKDCGSDGSTDQTASKRTVHEMGGTFLMHFFLTVAALIVALASKMMEVHKEKKEGRKIENSSTCFPSNDFDLEHAEDTFDDEIKLPPMNFQPSMSRLNHFNDPSRDLDFGLERQLSVMRLKGDKLGTELRERQDKLEQTIDEKLGAMMDLLKAMKEEQRSSQKPSRGTKKAKQQVKVVHCMGGA